MRRSAREHRGVNRCQYDRRRRLDVDQGGKTGGRCGRWMTTVSADGDGGDGADGGFPLATAELDPTA
ncbi:MAG: hypothetical protein ACRDD1_10205, partial [Planctomycetia bacterium]